MNVFNNAMADVAGGVTAAGMSEDLRRAKPVDPQFDRYLGTFVTVALLLLLFGKLKIQDMDPGVRVVKDPVTGESVTKTASPWMFPGIGLVTSIFAGVMVYSISNDMRFCKNNPEICAARQAMRMIGGGLRSGMRPF